MFCERKKIVGILSFIVTGIILIWGGVFFAEHFYALERNSFFAFHPDFLSAFNPWNPRPDMFPGEQHTPGLALLTASFAFQFFRTGYTALIAVILTGSMFSAVFTASLKRIWKRHIVLATAPLWATAYLFLAVSFKFPLHLVYALLWAGLLFLSATRIKNPTAGLVLSGLAGCCAVWLIGFAATMVFWLFYSVFFFCNTRFSYGRGILYGLFFIGIGLQPLAIGRIQAVNARQIYRSGFVEKWRTKGFGAQWHLYGLVKKTERLVMDGRYQEALEVANPYWFAHPCPIDDLITGRNTFYKRLSAQQIELRQWLAVYTKLALIGSHRINEDFFSYYRIPEIYDNLADISLPYFNKTKLIYDRLWGNSTGVYSQAMNLMELSGPDYFLLNESIPAALVCEQYDLAHKYIRLLESTLFYRKQATTYRKAAQLLRQPASMTDAEPEVLKTAAHLKELRNLGLITWMDKNGSIDLEMTELWKQNPASLENLEYLSLLDLLDKRLDKVAENIETYLALSHQTPPYHLPKAWQEMLFIMMQDTHIDIPTAVLPVIEQMQWDPNVLKQCRLFYQAREKYAGGGMTPAEITQRFGHTFAYNYYFRRFVDVTPSSPSTPGLAH